LGVGRPNQGCGEASDFDLADSKAAQTVMRAVTAYPLNDMQLEQIVKLALGKRVLEATAATANRDPPGVTTSVVRTASSPRTRPEVMSEDGSESHPTDSTVPEESPSANRATRPTTPSSGGAAAERCSEVPAAQQPIGGPPNATTTAIPSGKKRSRAARKAARAAAETGGTTPATSGEQGPAQEKPRQCPVFGCTRGHEPGDCPTFLDMTPKERLDMIHAKQLCLLCLQHPLSVGCEVASKGIGCPMGDCDRPHHAALHGVLKAGGPSPPEGKADLPRGPAVSMVCGTPEMARQLRSLLEGLGIDPNDLEVRIGVRQPGEPGRPHGGGVTGPAETKTDTARMAGQLLEALTSLCQAGERFVGSAAVSGRRMMRMKHSGETQVQRSRMIQNESTAGGVSRTPGRNSEWMERQGLAGQEREDDIGVMGERRRTLESSEYARGRSMAGSRAW
jgi:hypothetical protein